MDVPSSQSASGRLAAAALKQHQRPATGRSNHDAGSEAPDRAPKASGDNRHFLQGLPVGHRGKVAWTNTHDGGESSNGPLPLSYQSPFDDCNSVESTEPSCAVFSESSVNVTSLTTLSVPSPEPTLAHDHFKPRPPPQKRLVRRFSPPGAPEPARASTDEHQGPETAPSPSPIQPVGDQERRALSPSPSPAVAPPRPQSTLINAAAVAAAAAQTEELQKKGRRKHATQKFGIIAGLVAINFMLIFASWWWPKYYYIYLPFVAFPLVLNCIMITSITFFKLRNTIRAEKIIEPDHAESLVLLLPCYNETVEECTRSLDSLVAQVGIDDNKTAILVVCDGRVRGPGMQKSTADYLMEDILVNQTSRQKIRHAYRAWDGQQMDIEVSRGRYKGVPFYCIVKQQNMGKRDSLIVARSFLYKFNIRQTNPDTIFSPRFFLSMSNWLVREASVDHVDHLIGMDADTVFDKDCIAHLLKESRYPGTVGVCGYVTVDFSGGQWNLWSLYQNAEYTIAQGLRRLHQSIATKKVSCLPGCCQLLKICEFTCGDRVLIDLFAYHPSPQDNIIKQILATASEDRNHVCLMLTTHPAAQTRQALRARAYTDVPHSWTVFLSQRRRWTLGATSNDLMLFIARHCQWWERILALSNVLVWGLNAFVIASVGSMIVAFISQPIGIIMIFVGVMLIPIFYYIGMVVWMPRTARERAQYLAGLFIFVVFGPFLSICVMLFAIWNMDSFGWGKTRLVVTDDDEKSSTHESTRRSDGQDEEANIGMSEKRSIPPPLPSAPQV